MQVPGFAIFESLENLLFQTSEIRDADDCSVKCLLAMQRSAFLFFFTDSASGAGSPNIVEVVIPAAQTCWRHSGDVLNISFHIKSIGL